MVCVNLRGINATGKTTCAIALVRNSKVITITNFCNYEIPGHYNSELDLIVIGRYFYQTSGLFNTEGFLTTRSGHGCDGMKPSGSRGFHTQDAICAGVKAAIVQAKNVFFEGYLCSTLYGRYKALSEEIGGMIWAYLDTPLDICLQRLEAGRPMAGPRSGLQLGSDSALRTFQAKAEQIRRTREKAIAAGENVVDISHLNPVEEVLALFK